MDESQGLVSGYVTKVKQVACRVQHSNIDQVKPELEAVITEAYEHISIWVNGTPENNWKHFIGQIKLAASFGGDEELKGVLSLAINMAQALPIPSRKSK